MYYFKYNGIDFTDSTNMRTISMPGMPALEHSVIGMFEREGALYNGMNVGTRDIGLDFIVKVSDAETYDIVMGDVKRAFFCKEEAPLYLGRDDIYIMCVPIDDMEIEELGDYCAEIKINLIAYDPFWYTDEDMYTDSEEGAKSTIVTNNGDVATFPTIDVCVGANSTFVQVENKNTKSKILLGYYPVIGNQDKESSPTVLLDHCTSTSGWVQSATTVESDTVNGGTIGISASGESIKCADFGSASGGIWHGACYRKNLDRSIKDFKVKIKLRHNSTGKNGDPTVRQPYQNDTSQIVSGTKNTYYVVNNSKGLPVYKSPDKKSKTWGTAKKGYKITSFTQQNGWVKFSFKSKTGYIKALDLKPVVKDGTTTVTQINMVTMKPTAIRATPSTKALNLVTIPQGERIRVIKSTKYGNNKFYKMTSKYKGKKGYVYIDNLINASDYTVEYDEIYETADDKLGKIILAGYSSDSTQLFSLALIDDNEYYEFTYPMVRKNGKEFLYDKTVAPDPKISTEYSSDKAIKKFKLSGEYGSWNDFCGNMYIERINNVWYAYVTKLEDDEPVKKIKSEAVVDMQNADKDLAFLVLYIGTTGTADKASGMSLCELRVQSEDKDVITPGTNWQGFVTGDVIRIDNETPAVYINNIEAPGLIDVGSDFFKLEPGENEIVVNAQGDTPMMTITHKEKYL